MPLFRFDNYAKDLTPGTDWKPGDPWEQHFTNSGLDDRDSQLEDAISAIYPSGAGAPGGTGGAGNWYYDVTNKRLYLSDGIGWVIMSEPLITTFVPTVTAQTGTITTVGAVSFNYTRRDGWLDWYSNITITTNGTAGTGILFTLPINALFTTGVSIGHGMEGALTGKAVWLITYAAGQAQMRYVDNVYPGANGASFLLSGRYRMTTRYS